MNRQARFFQVMPSSDRDYEGCGVAYFPSEAPLFLLPREFGRVEEWPVYRLQLRDGDFAHSLANDRAVALLSREVMEFLADRASTEDVLQWLPVSVASAAEVRDYYVLSFPIDFEPLDVQATTWIERAGTVAYPRVPRLRPAMLERHNIFALRNGSYFFIVSLDLRRQLGRAFPGAFSYRPLDVAGPA